jgi:Tol biopolymer transport system component
MTLVNRYAWVLGMLSVLAVVSPATAGATTEGPQLAYVRDGLSVPTEEELLSGDQTGERWERLAAASYATGGFEELAWSWDGTRLAFGSVFNEAVYTVPAAGGTPRFVRGTKWGFSPAFSPDGKAIAFTRLRIGKRKGNRPSFGTSIWLVSSSGGHARQLTPWRDRLILAPAAFSPDGTSLLVERDRQGNKQEILSQPLAGGQPSLIVRNGAEPTYSPDGSSLAFVRYTSRGLVPGLGGNIAGGDLFVAASDGSGVRRLTFNPHRREESPGWDPSGERLVYTQFPVKRTPEALTGVGSSIMEINSDGTCRQRLLFTYGLSYREATWRPGPGRGLGRIPC